MSSIVMTLVTLSLKIEIDVKLMLMRFKVQLLLKISSLFVLGLRYFQYSYDGFDSATTQTI